jgi:ribosome recycling factor
MEGAVEALRRDLAGIRTGRASPGLVERLRVDYYGTPTPLNQIASISVPEARLLIVRPWDVNALPEIERAILRSDLGLMPSNDGRLIRLAIPPLTEERRRDLVKVVGRRLEEGRVAIRNGRRQALEDLRELQEEKLITEDDFFRARDDLQKLTDGFTEQVNELGQAKEAEIMEI